MWRSLCNGCPKSCGNADARIWGFDTEADLYAHLLLYHRKTDQYQDMHLKLWDEGTAAALRERDDGSLLALFDQFMHTHKYEKKTLGQKVAHHVTRIRHIVTKLHVPLTFRLGEDPDVLNQVVEWPEDISQRNIFSFLEVVQEVLRGCCCPRSRCS